MGDAIEYALQERDRFQFDYGDRLLMGVAYWRDRWVGGLLKPQWKELVQGPSPVSVASSLMAHHLGERRNQE